MFVAEPNRILEFDFYGNYITTIGRDIVTNLNGFDVNEKVVVAVSPDTLYWFSPDGIRQSKTPASTIISSHPFSSMQDAAIQHERISILDTTTLMVFRISK